MLVDNYLIIWFDYNTIFFQKHRSNFDEIMQQVRRLSQETRSKYEGLGQNLPSESGHQLSSLEIQAENLSSEISNKEEEFGRAGSVRSEFNQDVEEVQLWLQRSVVSPSYIPPWSQIWQEPTPFEATSVPSRIIKACFLLCDCS